MKDWAKPTIIISKCLGGTPCRYNGESSNSNDIKRLKEFTNIIEVCPEEEIGLPTPRNAIRLIGNKDCYKLMDPKTMIDYSTIMTEYASDLCTKYNDIKPTAFILKSRSPTCGHSDVKIYNSCEKGSASIKGKGFFAKIISSNLINTIIEEDGRLRNFSIRHNFLTKLFTIAAFRDLSKNKSINKLVNFHSRNKLLLMSYSQISLKHLGRIVANHEQLPEDTIFDMYEAELLKTLSKSPKYTSMLNAFNHGFGYVNENLPKEEKLFFLNILDQFKNGKIPNCVPINLLKSYAIRFNNNYLLSQTLLEPYPDELIDLSDSGKGIVR